MAPDEFLHHAPFLRRLAREVLRDPHLAEDAVQETWLAARRSPPRHNKNVRAWLASVVRNVARKLLRGDARRTRRERERPQAVPATQDDARERERVAHALCRLPEPYRTALVMRYYEDLPPREIAARLNAPVETVRTRLRRGLEKLGALLRHRAPSVAPLFWLSFRSTGKKTVAAAAVLVVAGIAVVQLSSESRQLARTTPDRTSVHVVPTQAVAHHEKANGRRYLLDGRLSGVPHDGTMRAGPLTVRADKDGRFVFDVTDLTGALEVSYDHPHAVPIARRWWPGDGPVSLTVRKAARVGGQVLGHDARPRADVLVGVFPVEADRPAPVPSDTVRTDSEGGFDLRTPAGFDRVLVAIAPGGDAAFLYDTGGRYHGLHLGPAQPDSGDEGAPMVLGRFRLQWFGRRVELVGGMDEGRPAARCDPKPPHDALRVVARGGHGQPLAAVVRADGQPLTFVRDSARRSRLFGEGRAFVASLRAGWHILEIRHPGYRPLFLRARVPGVVDVTLEVSR